jgi:two-component system, sensor histidine kinase PdtaS
MLRFVLLICVAACSTLANAQNIDSLKRVLSRNPPSDPNTIAYLRSLIGYHLNEQKQYDSALSYYYKAWSQKEGVSKPILAETANGLGAIYSVKDYNDSAMLYYEHAFALYKESKDSSGLFTLAANLAILYKDMGLYERALDVCFDVVPKLESREPSRELPSCYNTIAVVYSRIDENELALEFHKKALALRKTLGLKKSISHSYNNIGEIFTTLELYDSALSNLYKSLQIKKEGGDEKALPVTFNNIGVALMSMKRFKEAEPVFLEALNSKSVGEDRIGKVVTLNNLGRLYLSTQSYSSAARYLAEGESIIREVGSLQHL